MKQYHFNRTLAAQKASSKYCQASTSKQRELREQNRLQPYPCNGTLGSTDSYNISCACLLACLKRVMISLAFCRGRKGLTLAADSQESPTRGSRCLSPLGSNKIEYAILFWNCLKYVHSNSVPSRLLPNSCLLNPGRGPKSNQSSRLFPVVLSKGKTPQNSYESGGLVNSLVSGTPKIL